jgi:predicted DNA-binding transcriptional regulator AlpA
MDGSKTKLQGTAPLRGKMWTAAQVGKRLNLSEKTIYNWKASGELPIDYFYINGNLRFDSADVDDYISLSRCKSQKAQFDPNHLEEWLERTEGQIADMKKILKKRFR